MNIQGFTLIELLITLGLSAFILTGVYLLFSSQHRSYLLQQSTMQMQEIGRVATHILRNRLRQARGLGCAAWDLQLPVYIQAASLPAWLPQNAGALVQGYQGESEYWNPPLPSYLLGHVRPNTDVMMLHHAYEDSANLAQTMPNSQASLVVPGHLNLQVGDAVVIADCVQADIAQISSLMRQGDQWLLSHQPPYNVGSALSKAYNQEAEISVLKSGAYYIGDTGRNYANGEPIYALYVFTEQHQELVEGVSNLQIQYGVDTNHDNSVDTIMALPPASGQGILRSVMLMLESEALWQKQQWYFTVSLRN